MALARAKKVWAGLRQSWRRKEVSDEDWDEALAILRTYRPVKRSASERVKIRWDSDVSGESQRADPSEPVCGKVHLVTVCRHRGLDLNIENGIGDITLCHMMCRRRAKTGDLVVGITAAPTTGPAKVDGIGSRWPPAYHEAIQANPDDRRIVWMAVVDSVLAERTYHGATPYGRRQTVVYKTAFSGKLTLRITRKYEKVPVPGRNGPTLIAKSFTRYPANLKYAPFLPKNQIAMLSRIKLGLDRVCPAEYAQYYRDLFVVVHCIDKSIAHYCGSQA